jgi:hypothetical protein
VEFGWAATAPSPTPGPVRAPAPVYSTLKSHVQDWKPFSSQSSTVPVGPAPSSASARVEMGPGSLAAAVAQKLSSTAKEWKPSGPSSVGPACVPVAAPTGASPLTSAAPLFVPTVPVEPTPAGDGYGKHDDSDDDEFSPDELAMLDAEALRQDLMAAGTVHHCMVACWCPQRL